MAYNDTTDNLIVQDSSTNQLKAASSLKDADKSDLLMVQRGDTLYQARVDQVVQFESPPSIYEVKLTEDDTEDPRYTDQEFTFETTMLIDGEPAPEFGVKARLSGTTFDFTVKSDVITGVEGSGVKTCETDLIQAISGATYKVQFVENGPGNYYLTTVNWDPDSPGEDYTPGEYLYENTSAEVGDDVWAVFQVDGGEVTMTSNPNSYSGERPGYYSNDGIRVGVI